MGGPKALLVVDDKPLVTAHVERFAEAGLDPILVMVRAPVATRVRELLPAISKVQVHVIDTDSMAASLRQGLERVSPDLERKVLVTPVDALPARLATIQALLRAAAEPEVTVATPRYRGRNGHPVVARESLLQAFRDGYPGTLRDLLQSAGPRRHHVNVDDPAVAFDLNTPVDLAARHPGATPRFA